MSTQPHPLRPYYVPPQQQPPPAAAAVFPPSSAPTASSLPYARNVRNRYESTTTASLPELQLRLEIPTTGAMLRAFATSSIMSFSATAIVMPFEVGKTLAQVQWVPRDGLDPLVWGDETLQAEGVVEEEAVELEDEAEAEAYFSDMQSRPTHTYRQPSQGQPLRSVSPSGYLRRAGVSDARIGTKPEWIMPVVVQGGVWEMIRTVAKWKGEGWPSLWKGQFITVVLHAITTTLQPILHTTFTLLFLPTSPLLLSSLPLIHAPRPIPLLILSTFSHAVTSFLLSPLELVRTRLIVQSSQLPHRKYMSPLTALSVILSEEGGLYTTYFHPALLYPTLLEGILRPLLHLGTPLLISRFFYLEPSTSPIFYALAELTISSASLLITIPIETIRKRLQIQSRATLTKGGKPNGGRGRNWRTCVETRPRPYNGIVECVYRILTEETGSIPRRRRRSVLERQREGKEEEGDEGDKEDLKRMGLGMGNGLKQLYRGLGMGIGANVVVFVLGLVAGGMSADDGSGWAEM